MVPSAPRSCLAWLAALLLLAGCASEPANAIGECPQPRFTGKAPVEFLNRTNPSTPSDAQLRQAERLFRGGDGGKANCAACHGDKGNGKGALASQFDPPPRNFACKETVRGIPDGQLFWIIRYGSPGTAMPGHPKLSEQEVWHLVAYLRRLAG